MVVISEKHYLKKGAEGARIKCWLQIVGRTHVRFVMADSKGISKVAKSIPKGVRNQLVTSANGQIKKKKIES